MSASVETSCCHCFHKDSGRLCAQFNSSCRADSSVLGDARRASDGSSIMNVYVCILHDDVSRGVFQNKISNDIHKFKKTI